MSIGKMVLVALAAFCCGNVSAKVWFVNQNEGNDTAALVDDTGNTPFKTIQTAINKASDGDTVKVDPGTYNTSLTENAYGRSRIFIDKPITLIATGNRDNTVIEGAWHSSENYGLGANAIRCICAATNATIKGFTLRNGATQTGADTDESRGGGLLVPKSVKSTVKIADCAIVNCSATRGGGMCKGKAYRTIFKNCNAYNINNGNFNGAAARETYFTFCTIEGCSGRYVVGYARDILNCTFYNNSSIEADIYTDQKTLLVANCVFISATTKIAGATATVTTVDGCVASGSLNVTGSSSIENCCENIWGAGVISPMFGDLRPYANGPLVGTANVELMSSYDNGYADKDVMGNTVDWTSGKLCPGAYQDVVIPASGMMVFSNNSSKNNGATLSVDDVDVGLESSASNYTFATTWPTQYLLKASVSDGKRVARMDMYLNDSSNSDINGRPPLNENDETWITAPPVGTKCRWMPYGTPNVTWVDDDAEFAGNPDGTADKPFRTIQDAVTNSSSVRVICVKEGVYNTGSGLNTVDGLSRVDFCNGGYIRLIGVDGAEKTFIVGASSTENDPNKFGCGANAMRCVSASSSGVIQGFTLTGGRTDYPNDNISDTYIRVYGGMSVVKSGSNPAHGLFFVDCIISNNVAYRGGIGFGGTYYRCLFSNNRTIGADGSLKNAVVANCVIANNVSPFGSIGPDTYCCNSTIVEQDNVAGIAYGKSYIYNSVCEAAVANNTSPKEINGTVLYGFGKTDAANAVVNADPCFRDVENGDYRIATVSPAVGLGNPNASNWWQCAGSDFNGERYRFVNGKVISGAIQELVPSVRIGVSAGPLTGISTSGVKFLSEGGVTVQAMETGTRLFAGYSIDGEIVDGSDKSNSFTYNPEIAPVPGATLNVVYLTNWYVNATSGDDTKRGDTPNNAKKTLEKVLEYVVDGDVVHATEGEYNLGKMLQPTRDDFTPYVYSRAVLPEGVTLVADGERDKTIIFGEDDNTPEASHGCGSQAIRCVRMAKRSKLIGFTLRNGRTDKQNRQDENNMGGGVYAETGDINNAPQIIDCSIENCRSMRGGGSMYGMFRYCRFIGNTAMQGGLAEGAAGRDGRYYGCYFDNSVCESVLAYPDKVDCCTFGPRNFTSTGNYAPVIGSAQQNDAATITGTLFCGGTLSTSTQGSRTFVNCAYRNDWRLPETLVIQDCVTASAEELAQLDENGVPLPGKNPACDRGLVSHWTDAGLDAERDAAGNPRLANGAMDIGCYEADWKGVYSATVGKRGAVTFTEAEPYAYKGESAEVFLPKGVLSGKLNATGTGRYEFPVRITGGGKLVVTIGGTVTEYTTSGVVVLNLTTGEYQLSFEHVPCENDEGGVYVCSGGRIFGTSIVIR